MALFTIRLYSTTAKFSCTDGDVFVQLDPNQYEQVLLFSQDFAHGLKVDEIASVEDVLSFAESNSIPLVKDAAIPTLDFTGVAGPKQPETVPAVNSAPVEPTPTPIVTEPVAEPAKGLEKTSNPDVTETHNENGTTTVNIG